MVRLWIHESMRVFYDRLTDDHDREWLIAFLKEQVKTNFKMNMDNLLAHLCEEGENDVGMKEVRSLLWGDFIDRNAAVKVYQELNDRPALIACMDSFLDDFNAESKKPMNLVLFSRNPVTWLQ